MQQLTTDTVSEGEPQKTLCERDGHDYGYLGVRYAVGANPIAGSGARRLYYAHIYFCPKCAGTRGEPIIGIDDCTYSKVRFEATPGDPIHVGVPRYDRTYGGL